MISKYWRTRLKEELRLLHLLFSTFAGIYLLVIVVISLQHTLSQELLLFGVSIVCIMTIASRLMLDGAALRKGYYQKALEELGGVQCSDKSQFPSDKYQALQKLFTEKVGWFDGITYIADDWAYVQPKVGNFPQEVLDGKEVGVYPTKAINHYTVLMIELPYDYPNMSFDYRHNKRALFNQKHSLVSEKMIWCEGVFTKDYKLFAAPAQRIEVLSIASPELLERIQKGGMGADVFVLGNYLYGVFDYEVIHTDVELRDLFKAFYSIRDELIGNYRRVK